MGQLWDRRQHRVEYRTTVRLLPPGQHHTIIGTAVNISESGVFVSTPELWQIGTELVCDLPLPEDRLTLRGRVAWVRFQPQPEADPGMGIEFVDLTEIDSVALRELIGPAPDKRFRVRVRFEGMPSAINAEALRTDSGMLLRTMLPFLRLDSDVEFTLVDEHGDDESAAMQGNVAHVSLDTNEERVPRLQVVVRDGGQLAADALEAEADALETDALAAGADALAAETDALAAEAVAPTADHIAPGAVEQRQQVVGVIDGEQQEAGPAALEEPSVVVEREEAVPLTRTKDGPVAAGPAPDASIDADQEIIIDAEPPARSALEQQLLAAERSHWSFSDAEREELAERLAAAAEEQGEDEVFWEASSPPRRRFWLWLAAAAMAATAIASSIYTGFWPRLYAQAAGWLAGADPVAAPTAPARPAPSVTTPAPKSPARAAEPAGAAVAKQPAAKPAAVAKQPAAEPATSAHQPAATPPAAPRPRKKTTPSAAKTAPPAASARRGRASSSRRVPQVIQDGQKSRMTIAWRGSLRGKRVYPLANPDGLVVKLPHARVRLRHRLYRLKQGGFRAFLVRREGDRGVQLRFLFTKPTPRYALQIVGKKLTVTLTPAPAAAATTER